MANSVLGILLVVATLGASKGEAVEKGEASDSKVKNRLEQLYLWKVSDRLKLTPDQEAKFRAIYKEIVEARNKAASEIEKCLNQIEAAKGNSKTVQKLVAQYESLLAEYNTVSVKELERLKKFMGSEKLSEYLLLKREMTQKLKDVISHGGLNLQTKAASSPLKDPEVIQE
ncbi:MAG: hypothetical protein IT289_00585 [Oligoflexia bacterium]|nr:hypothetical protein [Oligoflexia bacterium]